MFPGGMNPKNMQRMMKQLGIKSEELPAKKVIFELESGKLVIEAPQVTAIEMQGQKTYTVIGEATEEKGSDEPRIPTEDVEMVATQSGHSKEEAEEALRQSKGDIAEAITKLKKG